MTALRLLAVSSVAGLLLGVYLLNLVMIAIRLTS